MPQWLVDLSTHYGYAAIFVGVFLENAGLPVPGETVLIAGAALAHFGPLSIWWVIATATTAAILGDNLGFFIGRRGGRALADRHGAKVGLTRTRLAQFDDFFRRHGAKTVFVARFVTGLRVIGAILAGGSGLPWSQFLLYNATGAVVWSSAVAAAGYFLAQSWDTLEHWIGGVGFAALVVFLLLVAGGMIRARRRQAGPSPPA